MDDKRQRLMELRDNSIQGGLSVKEVEEYYRLLDLTFSPNILVGSTHEGQSAKNISAFNVVKRNKRK